MPSGRQVTHKRSRVEGRAPESMAPAAVARMYPGCGTAPRLSPARGGMPGSTMGQTFASWCRAPPPQSDATASRGSWRPEEAAPSRRVQPSVRETAPRIFMIKRLPPLAAMAVSARRVRWRFTVVRRTFAERLANLTRIDVGTQIVPRDLAAGRGLDGEHALGRRAFPLPDGFAGDADG
jgi:hypothetical protein